MMIETQTADNITLQLWNYPVSSSQIMDLARLRIFAYGFPESLLDVKYQQAMQYNHPGTQSVVAVNDSGLLTAEYTTINLESLFRKVDPTHQFFDSSPIIAGLLHIIPQISGVYSICVSPDWKRRKLAQQMLSFSLNYNKPEYIIGGTQSPALLLATMRALSKDYDIFYGSRRLIDEQHTQVANSVTAYTLSSLLKLMNYGSGEFILEEPTSIPPTQYDLRRYPIAISTALSDVMVEQEKRGDQVTVTKPLIRQRKHMTS